MRTANKYWCAALAIVGSLATSVLVGAQSKVGDTRVVDVTITYVSTGKSSSINHVIEASCPLTSLGASQYGFDGPGRQQKAAQDNITAEAAKCGNDPACLMAFAQKIAQSGAFNKAAGADPSGRVATNFDLWQSQGTGCTGTLSANDRESRTSGPTMTIVASTTTTSGSAPVGAGQSWQGLSIQVDRASKETQYRFVPPPQVEVASTTATNEYAVGADPSTGSKRTSTGKARVDAFPKVAPITRSGLLASDKVVVQVPGGSVTFEWTIK